MSVNLRKCAVIGCGSVGSTVAYTLMNDNVFTELVLIDSNEAKAQGEAMDIAQGTPFAGAVTVKAGTYSDLKDAGVIIITAGANQRPVETRLELIGRNVAIFKSIIPSITEFNTEAILLVVANPVDVLTTIALKLSGFPANRVFGSGTVLDTARLKHVLSEKLNVDSRNVHAFIIGEHGDSELAVWSKTFVSGIQLEDYCQQFGLNLDKNEVYLAVRNSAYEIISRKGVTNYAIGMAVSRICRSIVDNENYIMPISSLIDGVYEGIEGVCIGLPAKVGQNGVSHPVKLELSAEELAEFKKSAATLAANLKQVGF